MLDAAERVCDLDGVSHDVLIFEDNIEAGDDVANQILRAETNGQAGESGKRGNGCDVDAEFLRGGEQRDGPDDFAPGAEYDSSERARLLLAGLRGACLGCGRLYNQLRGDTQKPVEEQGDKKDDGGDETGL